jgi:hypothetical protein
MWNIGNPGVMKMNRSVHYYARSVEWGFPTGFPALSEPMQHAVNKLRYSEIISIRNDGFERAVPVIQDEFKDAKGLHFAVELELMVKSS